ncbi:MAG: hypothetical protein ACI3VB_02870 [Oscillospiraceae bacterium]
MKNNIYKLYAGAGRAAINIPDAAFPTLVEGYTGVHDAPCVRVLILKSDDVRFVLANFELVSLNDDIDAFKKLISEKADIPEANIWICVTHSLPTPHLVKPVSDITADERKRFDLLHKTVEDALILAVDDAAAGIREAKFAFGSGRCDINVNRNIDSVDGVWLGCNDEGPSDKSVPIYKFEDLDGNVIAILFNYNAQCSIMDDSRTADGGRLVSADLSGSASAFVEQEFPGAVAMYALGAGGDQAPGFKGYRTVRGRGGVLRNIDLHEAGYILVELLGERLGQEVVFAAERLECTELTAPLRTGRRSFKYSGQYIPDMRSIRPCKEYVYIPESDVETPVEVLQIGEAALVGVKPEICVRTVMELKENSPYGMTGLMTFVNGGAKYMPEEDMYEKITFQSINSRFAAGTAEKFAGDILKLLNDVKNV